VRTLQGRRAKYFFFIIIFCCCSWQWMGRYLNCRTREGEREKGKERLACDDT
jgi:hypothetical protein